MNRGYRTVSVVAVIAILHPGGCFRAHQESLPSEFDGLLLDVWGPSDDDLFAVGQAGVILHYDGTSWTPMESRTGDILREVTGSSSSNVFAVGAQTVLHFDGREWRPIENDVGASLTGLWVAAENDVFGVGPAGTIVHFDGTAWRRMESGSRAVLTDVWGASAADVYAVGGDGVILHYDGVSWSPMPSGVTESLQGVSGTSGSSIYAVGRLGTILRYDGQRWETVVESEGDSRRWNGVHAFGVGEVRVVGWDRGTGGIEMYLSDGEWGQYGGMSEVNSEWGFSPTNYFIVGIDGLVHQVR